MLINGQPTRHEIAEARWRNSSRTLESGMYKVIDGEIRRVGDAPNEIIRYHGTAVPEGKIIDKLKLGNENVDSLDRPSISATPAIYASSDAKAAHEYSTWSVHETEKYDPQLYKLSIRPKTILDLGDCQDDTVAKEAIKHGFDVIECPKFWEQPETIIFNPDIVEIEKIYYAGTPDEVRGSQAGLLDDRDEQITRMKSDGYLSNPINEPDSTGNAKEDYLQTMRIADDDKMLLSVAEAVRKYRGTYESPRIVNQALQYHGASGTNTYSTRRGRGQLR